MEPDWNELSDEEFGKATEHLNRNIDHYTGLTVLLLAVLVVVVTYN